MALETGNYINDLVITNPTSTDPKSAGDDHFRLLKAVIKQSLNGFSGSILLTASDTGTAAAHVLTPSTALVGYTPMLCLLYLPANTNPAGGVTVNVSGLGAKSIKTLAGADPTAGDIVAGQPLLLMYNGTNFITLSGSEFLSKTGNQTLTGDFTTTGTLTANTAAALPTNTTIGTTTASELGYVHGVTSGIQAQINAKGAISGQTWTGTHDFTGAATTGVTKAPGTNTTDFATCAFVVQQAFLAALPAQGGNSGKYLTTNGTSASWVAIPPPSVIRSARTSNTILSAADSTTLIDITSGTFTQTFTAAATLGSGWYCWIRNSGTGDITLDPNASETIDGLTTFIMYPGEARLVQCDGVGFNSVVIHPFNRTFIASGAFTTPPGYSKFGGLLWAGGGSGAKSAELNAGGGAACHAFVIDASKFGASQTITIAATATGPSASSTAGTQGGNSSIGSLVFAYGGAGGTTGATRSGAGGGIQGAGVTGSNPGGAPITSSTVDATLGGANAATTTNANGTNSVYGGASGANGTGIGGNSVYGGGGGGTTIGTSLIGGNGGATVSGSSGGDGVAPGGGGGATSTGTKAGDGARGELRIWGVC